MKWYRMRVLEAHLDVAGESTLEVERCGGREGEEGLLGGRVWLRAAYLQMPGVPPERQLWGFQRMGSLAGLTPQCSNQ